MVQIEVIQSQVIVRPVGSRQVLWPIAQGHFVGLRALAGLLAHEDDGVRDAAAVGLGLLGDARAEERIRSILERELPEQGPQLRREQNLRADAQNALRVLDGSKLDLQTYADFSALKHSEVSAIGLATGLVARHSIRGDRLHTLRLRLEGQLNGRGFVPGYFGARKVGDQLAGEQIDGTPRGKIRCNYWGRDRDWPSARASVRARGRQGAGQ